MRDQLNDIGEVRRVVAIVGRLGVFPPVKLALPGRRILAYLALHGQPVTRSVAAAKLWPDVADETGRAPSTLHSDRGWTFACAMVQRFKGCNGLLTAQTRE